MRAYIVKFLMIAMMSIVLGVLYCTSTHCLLRYGLSAFAVLYLYFVRGCLTNYLYGTFSII